MRALIAMSGGVDSSIAAKLMIDEGYECIGCTMELFDKGSEILCGQTARCSTDDVEDARAVACRLGMPFQVYDLKDEFRSRVIDRFVNCYSRGLTPNPCVECNRYLKFNALMEKARMSGCEFVATGHYARIEKDDDTGRYVLKKGLDHSKDQSYVLYSLTQEQLAHIKLPLGGLEKEAVRRLAQDAGFSNAEKPESQDICFIPDGDYGAMIRRYSGKEFPPGDFVDLEGNVIGTHKGIIHYTIGQTRRLGQAFGVPRYVCSIDAENNRISLGSNEDVFSGEAKATDVNWMSGEIPKEEVRCKVRLRYKQEEQWATVIPTEEKSMGSEDEGSWVAGAKIVFDEPQRAVTPGQAAVFYDGDILLGGGTITG